MDRLYEVRFARPGKREGLTVELVAESPIRAAAVVANLNELAFGDVVEVTSKSGRTRRYDVGRLPRIVRAQGVR